MNGGGLLIDSFAGGGGASSGIEAALGRPVDLAVNHDREAIAMHEANHPLTRHLCQDVYAVDISIETAGEAVLGAWYSPDCKHHSKAKGGRPLEKNIRDLAWIVVRHISRLGPKRQPKVIWLENVEEYRQWGPLRKGRPCKRRKGRTFEQWVAKIRERGYKVEWREIVAADFGAPTSRKRFYLVARCDGEPIVWPQPTHGKPGTLEVASGLRKPWRTAADHVIDWTIPCPSIFERDKELVEATKRRIAHGTMRYVVNAARPFIVPVTHQGGDGRVHSIDDPLRTVTTASRGELAVVSAYVAQHNGGKIGRNADEPVSTLTTTGRQQQLVTAHLIHRSNGERQGQAPRAMDAQAPLGTAVAGGVKQAVVAHSLLKLRGTSRDGQAIDQAAPTVTAGGTHLGLVSAHLSTMRNADKPFTAADEPAHTVTAGGARQGLVSAFLSKYRRGHEGQSLEEPAPTITANSFVKRPGGAPPLAVVCAHIEQANTGMVGHRPEKPLSTIVGKGSTQRIVQTTLIAEDALPPELMDRAVRTAAFLIKYYGAAAHGQAADEPLDTVTSQARFAVVTVTIDAETYVIVDIGMRMLTPRELARAQGFPDSYILDPEIETVDRRGRRVRKKLTKTAQIRMIGNSVCPPVAEALVRANLGAAIEPREAAAA